MIRTVRGDIAASELGATFCHEHFLMTGGWPVMNEPDYRLDSVDAAVREIAPAMSAGLASVIEMTPNGFGRSARGLQEISERTGLNVIAATGLHKAQYYADTHWMHRYTAEQIGTLFAEEIELGMDENNLEGPYPDRTTARAGVIKVAAQYHRLGRSVGTVVEGAAIAHARTGAPIATHNDKGTFGHELLDLLASLGVDLSRVLLGHIDHNPDPVYLAELASRGASLVFDRPGRIKYAPDSDSVDLLLRLAESGHADRLLIGCDLARRSYWTTLGGGPGLAYTMTRFLPRLETEGAGELISRILVDNPARVLDLATP